MIRLLVLLSVGLVAFGARADAQTFKGRLLNGSEMYREALKASQASGFKDLDEKLKTLAPVPLGDVKFSLYLLLGKQHTPLGTGETNAEGAFDLNLTAPGGIPAGGQVVAEVKRMGRSWFSLPVSPDGSGSTDIKLYKASAYNDSDKAKVLTSAVEVVLTLADDTVSGGKLLRCRFMMNASTISGDLFVGRRFSAKAGTRRALYRVPIPADAKDLKASATMLHDNRQVDGWTFTDDGWAIVDNPLPPFVEAPEGVLYRLEYSVPARQNSAIVFPIDFQQRAIQIRGIHGDMEMLTPTLSGETTQKQPDPDDGVTKNWQIHYDGNVKPGMVSIGLSIDSMALGQMNEHTLKVVGGFVLVALIAVFLGLVLARSGPKVETLLSEATGEEIIERIAQLDAQFEQGRVTKAEYESSRERLLSLARYEVPELAASDASPAAGGSSLPAGVQDVLTRLQEIESEGGQDPRKIQERVLLLEELARSLSQAATAKVPEDAEESH